MRVVRLMPEEFTLSPNGLPSRGGSSARISRRAHRGSLPESPRRVERHLAEAPVS